jgi:hypothetical protein
MIMPRVPAAFEPAGQRPRNGARPALRFWSVRYAGLLEIIYGALERVLLAGAPVLARIGFRRLERPVALAERAIKRALFDCRMCGQCILSSTGMSCPMNCPKGLRNGPCGGVRADGHCEVYAEMPCVWVQAWDGSQQMQYGERIQHPQTPIDHRLKGRSSWLAVSRGAHAADQSRA